jgi:aminopeptidase N
METKAVAAWQPDWHVELDALQATHRAMAVDALTATRPVRTVAETPAEINELFDPIAYEKGSALLDMVEAYVGKRAFRGGINAYLQAYRYDNAAAEDFWTVMTRATGEPVDRILRSFIEQPGLPLISLETACVAHATVVTLTQQPFSPSAVPAGSDSLWTVPICLQTRGDGPADRCLVLSDAATRVELPGCARWVVGNKGADGYYRTRHGPDALARLRRANAELTPEERLALLADEWALLRSGRAGADAFMDTAAAVALDVRTPDVLEALGSRLQFLHEYVTTGTTRPGYRRWVRRQFEPALRHLERVGARTEAALKQRALLLALLGGVGRDSDVLADAHRQVSAYLEHPAADDPPATILDALVPVAALTGDRVLHQRFRARAEQARTPEERYRFLYGLAAFLDPMLLRATVDYALSNAVRPQDRALLIGRVLANPAGRELAWEMIRFRWPDLQAGLGAFGGTARVIEALGAFCRADRRAEIEAFFAAHPVPDAQRTLRQTLEAIDRCAALRRDQAPVLARWLHQPPTSPP